MVRRREGNLGRYSCISQSLRMKASYQSWVEDALYSLVICYGHKRCTKKATFEHATSKVFHTLLEEMMSFLSTQTKSGVSDIRLSFLALVTTKRAATMTNYDFAVFAVLFCFAMLNAVFRDPQFQL